MANIATGDKELDKRIQQWLNWDKNEESKAEIMKLAEQKNIEELHTRLNSRLEFGTAGLRGKMSAGFNMMNDLVIIQTSQGLAKYVLEACPKSKENGVIIGYDGRHHSRRFAMLSAAVMLSCDIPVYVFSDIVPTPYVPYSVLKYGCDCGIMVTASHNPKEDNGYKVYWCNGAQIIPPHDKKIAAHILENLEPWNYSWNADGVVTHALFKDPLSQVKNGYKEDLKKLCHHRDINVRTTLKFTYTAMHGVGYPFVLDALKTFGFAEPVPVKEQVTPDPDFPTVKFPNPEEGKSALDLAMKTADENCSTIILANDPDADRLAVAEKLPSGEWKIFSGNELGALLGWWVWTCYKFRHPKETGTDVYMLASTVSSKILKTIAAAEGFNFEETLTGFKWMGNRTRELEKQGKTVLLAFEEAIGFMCGTTVLDKDGVSASAVVAELAAYLSEQGKTLNQHLADIFAKYGFHVASNSYFICHHQPTIVSMFETIRNHGGKNVYPTTCGSYTIECIRDLTTGYDNSQKDCKAILPVSKSSQMITFTFKNGCVATLRTSGTEPKVKYYTEHCAAPGRSEEEVAKELEDMVQHIIRHFIQPQKHNFIARSS